MSHHNQDATASQFLSGHANSGGPAFFDNFIRNLPPVFRVLRVKHQVVSEKKQQYEVFVSLYHAKAQINAHAHYSQIDTQLKPGSLVKIRWPKRLLNVDGSFRVERLQVLQEPEASYNLFDTVPEQTAGGDALLNRARALEKLMSVDHRLLINHLFWPRSRLGRFLIGPASLSGHHNDQHGNFRHAIEVAELALRLQEHRPVAAPSLLITAALLHDAGKADEYVLATNHRYSSMSERGTLLGHKTTILEWVAVANERMKQKLTRSHYEALLHALSAVSGAPEWTGCRVPMSREAVLVNMADRVSSHEDLFVQNQSPEDGFGTFHKHLGRKPYAIREAVL